MPVPPFETLDDFFSLDEFATPAQFGQLTVRGILDREYFEADASQTGAEAYQPFFTMKESDLGPIKHGSSGVIDGRQYTVTSIQRSGTGLVRLVLVDK